MDENSARAFSRDLALSLSAIYALQAFAVTVRILPPHDEKHDGRALLEVKGRDELAHPDRLNVRTMVKRKFFEAVPSDGRAGFEVDFPLKKALVP